MNDQRARLLLSWQGALGLIILAVLLATGWMTGLEFQLDDYEQLYDASNPSGPAVLLGQDSQEQIGVRARPTFVQFFRPVLHASFVMDMAIFGARPGAVHAMSLAWHVAACFLLYLLLARLLPGQYARRTALSAALIFAVHPGKWVAISWIAARGDVLMTVFLLAAALAWRRYRFGNLRRYYALSFLLLLLALGSKEGAVIGPVLLVLLDVAVLRHLGRGTAPGRALLQTLPILALAPLYLAFRRWQFGDHANFYAGQPRVFSWSIVERMVQDFWPVSYRLIGGWFHGPVDGWHEFASRWLALGFFAALGFWLSRRPLRRSGALLLLLGLYAVAVFPPLRFYREASGFDASRLFYLPNLIVALAFAFAFNGFFSRLATLRRACFVLLIVSGIVWGTSAWRHYQAQTKAATVIERTRQDLQAIARTSSEPNTAFAIFDLPHQVDSAPCYGTFLTYAFGAPFCDPPILAKGVIHEDVFLGSQVLLSAPWPVRILKWIPGEVSKSKGHLQPSSPLLPAPRDWKPRIVLPAAATTSDGLMATTVKLEERLAPRDVSCLAVEFERVPTEPFELTLEFRDLVDSPPFSCRVAWQPEEFGSSTRALIPLERENGWLYQGPVRSFDVKWSPSTPPIAALDFAAELPDIELVSPAKRIVELSEDEPTYAFRDPAEHPWLRVHFLIQGKEITWTLRRSEFEARGDTLIFRASQPGFIRQPEGLREDPYYWDFLQRYLTDLMEKRGEAEIVVPWWVEGLRGQVRPAPAIRPEGQAEGPLRRAAAQARSAQAEVTFRP